MIELTKIERINEGNLLSFDVDNGDIRFSIIQYDNDYSYVKKALEIVAS